MDAILPQPWLERVTLRSNSLTRSMFSRKGSTTFQASSNASGRNYWYVFGGTNEYMTHRDGRPPVRRNPLKP